MTMLDDDRLASLLADAAATFEVPATGAQRHFGPDRRDGHDGSGDGDGDGPSARRRRRPPPTCAPSRRPGRPPPHALRRRRTRCSSSCWPGRSSRRRAVRPSPSGRPPWHARASRPARPSTHRSPRRPHHEASRATRRHSPRAVPPPEPLPLRRHRARQRGGPDHRDDADDHAASARAAPSASPPKSSRPAPWRCRRPRQAERDGHAADRARRRLRRLRGQLADAVGRRRLGQRDAAGPGADFTTVLTRPRRSARPRT